MSGEGPWRPGAAAELLLHAALDPLELAVPAWRRWSTEERIEQIDIASQRLLATVYRNLSDGGAEVSRRAMLAGAYRRAWYRNQLQFAAAGEAVRRLEEAGIPTIVIKGAALALRHYRDPGMRPMDDVDLVVAPEQARAAMAVLRDNGFSALGDLVPPDVIAVHRAWHFSGPGAVAIDLHWRVFEHSRVDERALWAASVPCELGGAGTRALCSAHELLLACAHGVSWNVISPVRWVSDAAAVLRGEASELDWDAVLALARTHELAYSLHLLLTYARDEFALAIPAPALAGLVAGGFSPRSRRRHATLTAPPGPVRNLRLHWWVFRGRRAVPVRGERRLGFVSFMARRWRLRGRRELPRFAAGRVGREWAARQRRAGAERRPPASS